MAALIPAMCCALAASGAAAEDQGPAMTHVRIETGLDRGAMAPGGSAMIGVRFVIEDGWHLYWRNCGDSGMPISVTFVAPEGVRIGPIQWPAPERYVYGHGSVDYIYEHEVALLAEIAIDDRFKIGDRIEITASIEVLACQEACVFGMGERRVVIDIAESTTMTVPEWMKKSQARIPRRDPGLLDIQWDGTDLLIKAYESGAADRLVFYPLAPSDQRPMNPEVDGISETGSLRIAYSSEIIGEPRVAGVVEIVGREDPVWIEIETTPPREATDEGGANEPTPPQELTQPINDRSGD